MKTKTFRSRLERQKDSKLAKKTVLMGTLTVLVVVLLLIFGIPLLIQLSVFLGGLQKGEIVNFDGDEIPPFVPRLSLPFTATSTASIRISGLAEPGVKVFLSRDGQDAGEVLAGEDGEFIFRDVFLEEGQNLLSVIAEDETGNRSESSTGISVFLDKTAPKLDILKPEGEGATTEEVDFRLEGSSERGVSVRVNERVAIVDGEGNWYFVLPLLEGKNEVEVKATDEAGNETSRKVEITLLL